MAKFLNVRHFTVLVMWLLVIQGIYGQQYKNGVQQGVVRIKVTPSLVQYSDGIKTSTQNGLLVTGIQTFDRMNAAYGVRSMKRVFPYSPKYEARHRQHGLHLWYEIAYNATMSPDDVVKAYANLPEVEVAELSYEHILAPTNITPIDQKQQRNKNTEPFNDPFLPQQWHYHNVGQSGGIVGADINLYEAWKITTGTSNVIVSVHDEGVDYKHEDLRENMWVNYAELNGKYGVDDDGNGYRDDIYGFNFADYIGDVSPMPHGTHVAGTVAAVNNNGIGVSGVAGGSGNGDGVRIMSLQIFGNGTANTEETFVYAADNGAVISQNSWGYSNPEYYQQVIHDAIDYFIAEAGNYSGSPMKGGVVIFASGNSNWEFLSYPGAYPNVIAVSALGSSYERAPYSNYGTWVDISAPGGHSELGRTNQVLSTLPKNNYGFMEGTSMACPHVSGIAALIVSKFASNTFTNEMLKQHLMTATVPIDNYNPQYEGKLGLGLANAALSLADDNKIAPNQINDLTVTSISQDFANVAWTVPSDNDDQKPVSFQIVYSTSSDMTFAKILNVKTTADVGEKQQTEITGLLALTTYYFAVKSTDRWGNQSQISNIVAKSTNAGPLSAITPDAINIDINTGENIVGSTSFLLNNTGEGVLKYSLEKRHVSNYDAWRATHTINYPVASSKPLSINRLSSVSVEKNEITTFGQQPISDDTLYYDPWEGLMIVGETDLSFTNSSATRFKVDNPEGFNLTNVSAYLRHNPATGPFVVEIYRGHDINTAQLIFAQEEQSFKAEDYYHEIQLSEQIYFPQGTEYWIVVHVPANNLYPLGIGLEQSKEMSDNCYMSVDMGKSWARLEDVFFDNRVVWAVAASSRFKYMGEYIDLSAENGTVLSMSADTIGISVDASQLINGTFTSNIVVNTNEKGKPMLRVPVTINVSGQKPHVIVPEIVNMGNVLLGDSKKMDVLMQNFGYGKFKNFTVEVSNPDFVREGWTSNLDARMQDVLTFTFTPSQAGNANAIVTLTDENANVVRFALFGVGAEPPVAKVSPADTLYNNLNVGDTIHGSFAISNTGKYPLKYYVPAFSTGSEVSVKDKFLHKFGYTAHVNNDGNGSPTYVWNDISATGQDITEHLTDQFNRFYPVDLNFDFPFFGKKENKMYITYYALISFDQNSTFNSWPLRFKDEYSPDRFICALGTQFSFIQGGAVYYQQFSDHVVVQYDNAPYPVYDMWTGQMSYTGVTLQIVLHDNGNIRFYYKDLGAIDENTLNWYTYAGIEDQTKHDGLDIHDQFLYLENPDQNHIPVNGSAVGFDCPGMGIVTSMDKPEGLIFAGETVNINYTIATGALTEGNIVEKLNIVTNDPIHNPLPHTMHLNIVSGGVSNVSANTDTLQFGQVYQAAKPLQTFTLSNSGTKNVTVRSAAFKHSTFSLANLLPIELKAGRTLSFDVKMKTNILGIFTDTLTINTNENQTFTFTILGEVINAPAITVTPATLADTLQAGSVSVVKVTVKNTGKNTLIYTPTGNNWLHVKQAVPTPTNVDYAMTSSKKANSVAYNWIEVMETGTPADTLDPFDMRKFWDTIPMPFSFNFYGVNYDTLYVGFNGVLSFQRQEGGWFWGGPPNIPQPDGMNNFIAPMWVFGGPDDHEFSPLSGIYYQTFTDKVVVQYQDYMNNFGMGDPISFQAILYKNGDIKFQYKTNGVDDYTSSSASVGIENQDGTRGVLVYANQEYIVDKTAIYFTQNQSYSLAPSAQKTFDVTFDASSLFAGNYSSSLKLHNNTPTKQSLEIAATLNVIGAPQINAPDTLDYGAVMAYMSTDEWGSPAMKTYNREFEIKNNGTANLEINSLALQNTANEATALAYVYVDGPWGGWQWSDVNWLSYPLNIAPNESIKMMLMLQPSGDIATLDNVLHVQGNTNDSIVIKASAIKAPILHTNTNVVNVAAQVSSFTDTTGFVLDNKQGASPLQYTLALKVERGITENSAAKITNRNSIVRKPDATILSNHSKSARSMDMSMYNRVLQYDTLNAPSGKALGFGGQATFIGATGFVAPTDGFNLTHVGSWFVPLSALSARITVEIWAGSDDITQCDVIHSQVYNYTGTATDNKGSFITVKLDKNINIFAGEKFFVVFKYPLNITYPQGTVDFGSIPTGTFMYSDGETWGDIAATSFSNLGWLMKAMEEKAQSKAWITLETPVQGILNVGDSVNVQLSFNAANAKPGNNKAKVVITSNDPIVPSKTVNVNLYLNQAPVADKQNIELSVKENQTVHYTIQMSDPENNNFTVNVTQHPTLTTVVENGKVQLSYAPDYNEQGLHTFIITATDQYGAKSETPVKINVLQTNRAPVATTANATALDRTDNFEVVNLYNLFSDPDGDVLSFTGYVTTPNMGTASFTQNDLVLLLPHDGVVSVYLKATDPVGDTASAIFTFNVFTVGINNLKNTIAVSCFPNPVVENATVSYTLTQSGNTSLRLVDFNGKSIWLTAPQYQTAGNHHVQISAQSFVHGAYMLIMEQNGVVVGLHKLVIE